ncbi:MAG: hypothetical protein QOI62_1231 [Solirubrobacteraceae bacterium]|jgi:hypothetical protein|nr:hypothetical protein [Solirubrobacteraceae bacterium]
MNQAIFAQVDIWDDNEIRGILAEPFASLLDAELWDHLAGELGLGLKRRKRPRSRRIGAHFGPWFQ